MSSIAFGYEFSSDQHLGCFSSFAYQLSDVARLQKPIAMKMRMMIHNGRPTQTALLHESGRATKGRYLLVLWLLACFFTYTPLIAGQADMVLIEGSAVADSNSLAGSDLTVSVNGQSFTAKIGSRYAVRVPRADIYQLRFDSQAAFTGIYTFAEAELRPSGDNQYVVPQVELVARKPLRVQLCALLLARELVIVVTHIFARVPGAVGAVVRKNAFQVQRRALITREMHDAPASNVRAHFR